MGSVHFALAAALAAALCLTAAAGRADRPGRQRGARQAVAIPWEMAALSKPPQTYPAPGPQAEGVQALFYEGPPLEGKRTTVFAFYGKPKGASAKRKVPGIVLVHGGGGTAFDWWVRLWNKRGYAAIAMDHGGGAPQGFKNEFPGPGLNEAFSKVDSPPEDQWPYHAVAQVVLANSLLRSFPEVDANRIGITGLSWGGYLTCMAAGVDKRFRFAVPVYGCGFLHEDSAWLPTFEQIGPEQTKRWVSLWDPSRYLPLAQMPILWVTGTNDFAYPLDSLEKSYHLPRGPRTLAIRVEMSHAHGGAGENPPEILAFAQSIVSRSGPLPHILRQGRNAHYAWARFTTKAPIVKAEFNYTTDSGVWKERKWHIATATLDQSKTGGRVTAKLPRGTTVFYFNLWQEAARGDLWALDGSKVIPAKDRLMCISTEHVELGKR